MLDITIAALTSKGIRPMDVEAINKLSLELTQNPEPLTLEEAKDLADKQFLVVARLGGIQIVGMTTLLIDRIPTKRRGRIDDVVVTKEWRGNDISRMLMEFVIEIGRNRKVQYFELTSRLERIEARNLYGTLGFEQYETGIFRLYI